MKLIAIGLTFGVLAGGFATMEGGHMLNVDRHVAGPRYEVVVMPAPAGGAVFLDKDTGESWFLCPDTRTQRWCSLDRSPTLRR